VSYFILYIAAFGEARDLIRYLFVPYHIPNDSRRGGTASISKRRSIVEPQDLHDHGVYLLRGHCYEARHVACRAANGLGYGLSVSAR